jgi:Ca2+-binding EF-hand superfamily protein
MKLVSIDLTDMEIKKIMERVDANHDGMISYEEFSAKFRD